MVMPPAECPTTANFSLIGCTRVLSGQILKGQPQRFSAIRRIVIRGLKCGFLIDREDYKVAALDDVLDPFNVSLLLGSVAPKP